MAIPEKDKLKEILEACMKQCFDKGIEIGLANNGKIEKVTISVIDIRDKAYFHIQELLLTKEEMTKIIANANGDKDYKKACYRIISQALHKAQMEKMSG